MNPWSDLPNAKYIGEIVASANANPDKWAEVWETTGKWTKARDAAWEAACVSVDGDVRDAVRASVLSASRHAVREEIRTLVWDATWVAILALASHDDCAHLLNTNPDHVKILAGIGNEAAIMLYPAVLIFSEMKNECLV